MKNKAVTIVNNLWQDRSQTGDFDKYYRFGYMKFGPFLYGFSSWLKSEFSRNHFDRIFFFSRDGYMMQKGFRELGSYIPDEYVYFSRKSLRQALLHYCGSYQEALQYLTWERYISLGKLLEYFGFSHEEACAVADKGNIPIERDYAFDDLKDRKELIDIYSRYHDIICGKSEVQDGLLYSYLQQIGMKGNTAIVDIGWKGSMQYYLEEYCRLRRLDVTITGFYIGISSSYPVHGRMNGYLYQEDRMMLRKKVLCFFGVYEKLFQSLEGSTCGYMRNAENMVVPVFSQYEYEHDKEAQVRILSWQQGALDFMKDMKQKAHPDVSMVPVHEWAYDLVHTGMSPSMEEVRLLSFLYNTDGTRTYYTSQKPLYAYSPKELKHTLSNSEWKTGFMKSVFRIRFPYFWIYTLMKK